jgi:hypothetical protein
VTNVLDHGYVNLVDTWGSDQTIVEAARMSTGKGFLGVGHTGEVGRREAAGLSRGESPRHAVRTSWHDDRGDGTHLRVP